MCKRSLKFHIRANDYFGTLATVLDLVSQDLRKKGYRSNADTLGRQRDRLMYLQQGYRIEKIQRRGPERSVSMDHGVSCGRWLIARVFGTLFQIPNKLHIPVDSTLFPCIIPSLLDPTGVLRQKVLN